MPNGNGRGWGIATDELKPALELALTLEHTRMGFLMLLDGASGELKPAVCAGLTEEQCVEFGRLNADGSPLAAALAARQAVIARRATRTQPDEIVTFAQAVGAGRVELFPLWHDGHVLGALALFPRGRRRRTSREVQMVERCAQLLAITLDAARSREEFERRCHDAEATAAARVQFLAKSSHELRTPLQSITGYIELLKLGVPAKPTREQERMLERIEVSEKLLLAIIDDLITFARLEAGRLEYDLRPVVLHEVMSEVQTIIAPLAERRRVHLAIDPVPTDVVVNADAPKLSQILVNLLGNAVRMLPAGGTVCVSAYADGRFVRLDVADDGPGIDPAKLPNVFQPFAKLAGSVEARGSGLGLSICRELATGMGAELTVASEPGRGAVFSLRLERTQSRH